MQDGRAALQGTRTEMPFELFNSRECLPSNQAIIFTCAAACHNKILHTIYNH